MKKTIVVTGIALTALYYLGKNKAKAILNNYQEAFRKLIYTIHQVQDIRLSGGQLTAKVSLHIQNNSTIDLTADTSGYITLKKLTFYTKSGNFIGEAFPNITQISIPISQPYISPFIPIQAPLNAEVALELALDNSSIQVRAEIEALGQTYTL